MNNPSDEIVGRAVRSLDPYPDGLLDDAAERARMSSILEQILLSDAEQPTATKPRSRQWWAVAVPLAAAAVAAALIVTQPSSPSGGSGIAILSAPPQPLVYVASTKTLSAPVSLAAFADRVASLPEPEPDGSVLRITTRSFDLLTVVGERGVESTLEEHHTTRYISDGVVTTRGRSNGSSGTLWGDMQFSEDVDDLRQQLQIGHPVENGVQSVLAAITDLYREAAPTPGVRAGILNILSEQGMRVEGVVTDRAGRAGVGYSVVHSGGGLPKRVTLIFDPDTGWLLSQETVLIETAGALNVPIPSVSSYEIYTSYDYIETIPAK